MKTLILEKLDEGAILTNGNKKIAVSEDYDIFQGVISSNLAKVVREEIQKLNPEPQKVIIEISVRDFNIPIKRKNII